MRREDARRTPRLNAAGFEPRISETVEDFLEYIRIEDGRVPVTIDRYRRHIERVVSVIGDCPVTQITGEKISLFKKRMIGEGLGPSTMSGQLACLRTFLRYLREVRHLDVFEPTHVRRPKIPRRKVQFLSKEEVQRFLAAIPTKTLTGARDRALIELLCSSGMRISEALSLDRHQINWEKREAVIIGKGNVERTVYFSEEAVKWLQQYLARRWDSERAVFVTNGAEPKRLRAEGGWRRFHRYSKKAGLGRDVYPHLLRHTMATTLLANGCPIGHIRTLLGHANLATTCKYYLGVISDAEAKAAHAKYLWYEPGDRKVTGRTDEKGAEEWRHKTAGMKY